jgi:hypothetical protein
MLWCGRFSVPSFSEIIDIVPIVPKSVKAFSNRCNGCRHLAVPSPGIARRRVFEEALWAGIFGVLQTSQKIFMNSPWIVAKVLQSRWKGRKGLK